MSRSRTALPAGLLVLLLTTTAPGQSPGPPAAQPPNPGLRKLTGDDEKRAKQLDEQVDKAVKADHWPEAIAAAEELSALRSRLQGPKHFETVNEQWRLKTLRQVAPMPEVDRVDYQSAQI